MPRNLLPHVTRSPRLCRRILPVVCALSLSACGPAPAGSGNPPMTGPSSQPLPTPSLRPTAPPSASAPASPAAEAALTELSLHLQADASLAAFQTAQLDGFELCLGGLAATTTELSFADPGPAALAALRAAGLSLRQSNGRTSVMLQRALGLPELIAGITLQVAGMPIGDIEGVTRFLDASGAELGAVSWSAELRPGSPALGIRLSPEGSSPAGTACPRLKAILSNGSLRATTARPAASPAPALSASPSVSASPASPLNLRVVEQAPDSLTLQWDFAPGARSHRLYLDGQLVAEGHTFPDYFRFEGLQADTSYRLGVQSVNSAGVSEIASLSTATTRSGRTGSGAFSRGGDRHGSLDASPSPTPSPSPTLPPDEFQVNAQTAVNQTESAVASDGQGNFVIVWVDDQAGSSQSIIGRHFDALGQPASSEFVIGTVSTGYSGLPAVAMDDDGDFVVVWQGLAVDGSDYGVQGRYYSAGSVVGGTEFSVNTYTTATQYQPAVAMDGDGDFVVAWQGYGQPVGSSHDIIARHFSAGASPAGAEFMVNVFSTNNQGMPAIAMDGDGDFTVVWHGDGRDGSGYGISGRHFSAGSITGGAEFVVNSHITGFQAQPWIDVDADGDFVVSWLSDGQDGNGFGIFAKRFAPESTTGFSEIQVNSGIQGNQSRPAVAMDESGDFAIFWQSDGQDGSGYGIFGKLYSAGSDIGGTELQANSFTAGRQALPSLSMTPAGNTIVTWQSEGNDGAGIGIAARIYPSP